jgi:hypothetical protein
MGVALKCIEDSFVNNKTLYTLCFSITAIVISVAHLSYRELSRDPAAIDERLTLEVQTLRILKPLNISKSDTVFLNLAVNRTHNFEMTPRLHLGVGDEIKLNSKVVIDPKWVKDGNLEFKIELVKVGLFKNVLLRCAQVSKGVEELNRSYECRMPGSEETPALVYSLRKVPVENAPLAKD